MLLSSEQQSDSTCAHAAHDRRSESSAHLAPGAVVTASSTVFPVLHFASPWLFFFNFQSYGNNEIITKNSPLLVDGAMQTDENEEAETAQLLF